MPDNDIEKIDTRKWFSRIEAADKYMQNEFVPRYELARKRLRSELEIKTQKRGRPVHHQVNLVYGIGVGYVNSVVFKMPEVNLTARNPEERDLVENTEIKINDFFKDAKVKRTARRGVWDAFLGGFHARYVDWDYKDVETDQPIMIQTGVDPVNGTPISEPVLKSDGTPQFQRIVVKNAPVYKRVRPDLIRFPSGFDFDEYQDSPWIGFDVILPVDDVKNDEAFDATVTANITGKAYQTVNQKSTRRLKSEGDDDVKYTKLHYVFIRPEMEGDKWKLLVLNEEIKTGPLKYEIFDKGQVGCPIKFLYHNPLDDDDVLPCGDPWIWESQLRAIDDYWQRVVSFVRKSNPKYVYNKGDVPKDTITQLKSNEGSEYVGVEPKLPGKPAGDVFNQLPELRIHPDNDRVYMLAENILNRVAPKTSLSQGDKQKGVDTATEASIIQQGEFIDLDARADDIREYFIDLARDLAGLYVNNLVGETDVQGTNAEGVEINRRVGKEGFTTNFEIDINVESMQSPNRDIVRRQLMDMVGTLKILEEFLMRKGKAIDGEPVVEMILDTFRFRNKDKVVVPLNQRNPNQQHEDAAFHGVPFEMDHTFDLNKDLEVHMQLINDPVRLQSYEQVQPGFSQALQDHVLAVNDQIKGQSNQPKKAGAGPAAPRNPQATEQQRANQV